MCASVRCVRCTVCGSASGEVVLDTSALYGWLFDGGGERRGRLGRNGDRPVRLRLRGWPVCTRSWRRYRFCAVRSDWRRWGPAHAPEWEVLNDHGAD